MAIAELSRIDRTVDIQATPERVWRALTDPHELAAWFRVKIEGHIAPGAEVWMSSVLPQHAGQRWPVRIVEMTRPRRMVWQWHPGEIDLKVDYAREPQTTVTFTLEPSALGTRVSVTETGFDAITLERRAKAYADNTQGWTEVMAWLQEYAQTAR